MKAAILAAFARKVMALSDRARQAIADHQRSVQSFAVGITATLGEYLVSQIFESYCREHPEIHINIVTNTINKSL